MTDVIACDVFFVELGESDGIVYADASAVRADKCSVAITQLNFSVTIFAVVYAAHGKIDPECLRCVIDMPPGLIIAKHAKISRFHSGQYGECCDIHGVTAGIHGADVHVFVNYVVSESEYFHCGVLQLVL